MRKCLHLWTDPTQGRSGSAVGPYRCGRKHGHTGSHAWDGNGASALWSDSGELLLSIQQVPLGGLAALSDALEQEAAAGAAGGVGSAERREGGGS